MRFYEDEDFTPRRRRRPQPDLWHRLNMLVSVLILAGVLLTIGVIFYPVLQKQRDMRAHLVRLEQEQAAKTADLSKAQRQIDLLRSDPEYVETIARDRLNLMKPGETVFRVELPPVATHVLP
jgi:cell division protein FtsB